MDTQIVYGGFWRRAGALVLDMLILMPAGLTVMLLGRSSPLVYTYYALPAVLLHAFYFAWLVKRYGGTPGHRIMGMRVLRLDGAPVGWREALLRDAPRVISLSMSVLCMGIAGATVNAEVYGSLGFGAQQDLLEAAMPAWFQAFHTLQLSWTFSELLVLLTNAKRRALHDFLAGTVVVRDPE